MINELIAEKILRDGRKLKIDSWISTSIEPGRRMYQLQLIRIGENGRELIPIQFPSYFEKYTKEQIEKWYENINSERDFEAIRRNTI